MQARAAARARSARAPARAGARTSSRAGRCGSPRASRPRRRASAGRAFASRRPRPRARPRRARRARRARPPRLPPRAPRRPCCSRARRARRRRSPPAARTAARRASRRRRRALPRRARAGPRRSGTPSSRRRRARLAPPRGTRAPERGASPRRARAAAFRAPLRASRPVRRPPTRWPSTTAAVSGKRSMGRIVPTCACLWWSSVRPIASGKSALSRAVAAQLEEADEVATAVIDLDRVDEMLDPRRTKDDSDLWAEARRVAGRLTTALLAAGRCVVAEGEFAGDLALDEFASELPGTADLRLVLLDVDFETALKRASADATRGLSKDETFLCRHYREFRPELAGSRRAASRHHRIDARRGCARGRSIG